MSSLPPPPPTRPLEERLQKASTLADLLALMSEAGRMADTATGHKHADAILAKTVKIVAKGHPDGKEANELARRFLAMDKRYYAPD